MVPQRHPIPLTPRTTLIKHLFEAEMQAHREKGLCYNCDDKFTRGHQCTEHKPYLLDVASSPALEICDVAQDAVDDQVDIRHPPIDPHISKQVDCFVPPFSSFKFMVANGSTLP